jgi:hypothetical protein
MMTNPLTPSAESLDWFEAGEVVFLSSTDDSRFYPPLDEPAALRAWLTGFAAAWSELPENSLAGDPAQMSDTVYSALLERLTHRPELAVRLLRMTEAGYRWIH